ncbi:MAG: hypothetical protein Q9174_003659 [Haloplaca sp. 1 TL-2023]
MGLFKSLVFLAVFLSYVIATPKCFKQPPEPRPQLYPAGLQDCLFVAQLLLHGDKAQAPIHWGRSAGLDIWGKSCFVTLDMLPEYYDDEVVFSMTDVSKVVINIINWCQTSEKLPRLGGRDEVGLEQKTVVILAGKIPEKGPKPPGSSWLRLSRPQINSSIATS